MKNLRIKLLISLIAFALILVTVIFYFNRQILTADIEKQEVMNRTLIENHILTDMQTVDNAHYYFDKNLSEKMEAVLRKLITNYEENPHITKWDLQKIKNEHGMDVYILDQSNTVIYTTFEKDKGLNFSQCCTHFSTLLDTRRVSGEYYADGIDISTTTGGYRKFGYLATPDKKYLFEVGIDLLEDPVFQTFNFVKTADYLIDKYADLLEVQTISAGGIFFDDSKSRKTVKDQSEIFQEHFELAKKTMKPTEYEKKFKNGYIERYRFLPYNAETVRGASSKRVVYVKYGNFTEIRALTKNTKQFRLLLGIALVTSFIMLLVINKLLSKTIHLATYDPLTNVYNRATYIRKMGNLLRKRKTNQPGLLLLDLDNFKQVNDRFGHVEGDKILIETARILKQEVGKNGFVVRFGGDEFAIVLYDTKDEYMERLAHSILEKIHHLKYADTISDDKWSVLSVSMGGAICSHPNESERSLFERADKALYQSKNAGKDQYSIYEEVTVEEER
ncbi:GGDEF domain-containing protein [Lysinibacillus xylanilyticus]|uniref:GGDEF domain-containing protein n=1 Tax=Lysinibacillus xylanilyticus TaxID=582475 RepID=UPI002B247D7B|nr:GGDEF domain-containing protein [Lysinibacillus xylanilyticus]MEB2302375.1 GGDEF domain-containing protein [Lysinibacillus xylanilyticus]